MRRSVACLGSAKAAVAALEKVRVVMLAEANGQLHPPIAVIRNAQSSGFEIIARRFTQVGSKHVVGDDTFGLSMRGAAMCGT